MTKTNKQLNKVVLLLTFLLFNGIIVGCDSCKSEKEKLEQEEKVLMEKLKKQVKPEAWEEIEKKIKKAKDNKQKIEKNISKFTDILKDLDGIKDSPSSAEEQEDMYSLLSILKDASTDNKKNLALAKQFVTDFLALAKNLKKQAELKK